MANNKKNNFKDVKLGKYQGKGFTIFAILVTVFILLSFLLSLGTKGAQKTFYAEPPKTNDPKKPSTPNNDEVHALGGHNWNWMNLSKVEHGRRGAGIGGIGIGFNSPEKKDNTPYYDKEGFDILPNSGEDTYIIAGDLINKINKIINTSNNERVEVKLNTYGSWGRGEIDGKYNLDDFSNCAAVRNGFTQQEIKDGLKIKEMGNNYYYTYPIIKGENNRDYYVDILLKVYRKPKAPTKPAPIIEDQEVVNISFDSAKIADIDNNYIVGRDYGDENVNDIGVFNLVLRKEGLENYTISYGVFDEQGNKVNKPVSSMLERDLFAGEVVKNPFDPLLKNFLIFSNGIKFGGITDCTTLPCKSRAEKYIAWDDRRRTNHIPNYLMSESNNPLIIDAVEKLNYVNYHRPVVPELKKSKDNKPYTLSFRRPVSDGRKDDVNGKSFYLISGYETDINGNKGELKNKDYPVSKIGDFVEMAVNNYGKLDESKTKYETEDNFVFKHHRGNELLPFLQLYNDYDHSGDLYYLGFDSMAIEKEPATDKRFKHVYPIDDGYSKTYNMKKYYTTQQLLDIGFTGEEITKISNGVKNGKVIRPSSHLVSYLDIKMERNYNEAFLEYNRLVPWKMTKKNNITLIPKQLKDASFRLADPGLETENGNLRIHANKDTMLLEHPYNTLFEYDGTLQIELSQTAREAIMEMIKPENGEGPERKFNSYVVSLIEFDGTIGEDGILHINIVKTFIYQNRTPNGERSIGKQIGDVIGGPFRMIGKLIDAVTAFFGIGGKGFMGIGIIILLILAGPILSPIMTLIGTFLSLFASGVKNLTSSISSKKDKKGS